MTKEDLEEIREESDVARNHQSKAIEEILYPPDNSEMDIEVSHKELSSAYTQALLSLNEAILMELRYLNDNIEQIKSFPLHRD